MPIKKRKYMESAKTGQIGPDIPTAKTGPIGGPVPSANKVASNPVPSAKTAPYEMTAVARLRAAKKVKEEAQAPRKSKLVGEVSLGPTEAEEKPEREGFLTRIKKRAK